MKNIILKGLFFCSLLLTMQPLSAANTVEKVEKVSGVVTLNRAVDYVVTSATPFADGAVVNITDVDNAVLILAQVKPSKATALYSHIQINGVKASSANCMVKIYADGSINRKDDKAGFWKCPYHNGRMCMEIVERIRLMIIQ